MNGLISYLPAYLRNFLLHRSIFDVLCDQWFYPRLRTLALIFVKKSISIPCPKKAIRELRALPRDFREKIQTRGMALLLPSTLMNLLVSENMRKVLLFRRISSGNLIVSSNRSLVSPDLIRQIRGTKFGTKAYFWDKYHEYMSLRFPKRISEDSDDELISESCDSLKQSIKSLKHISETEIEQKYQSLPNLVFLNKHRDQLRVQMELENSEAHVRGTTTRHPIKSKRVDERFGSKMKVLRVFISLIRKSKVTKRKKIYIAFSISGFVLFLGRIYRSKHLTQNFKNVFLFVFFSIFHKLV